MELLLDCVDSPIGPVLVVGDGERLCALDFAGFEQRMLRLLRRRWPSLRLERADDPCGISSRVRAYFGGALDALAAVPVETGGTPFQRRVWSALREIPPGSTTTYGALAARLGRPSAGRAVGLANATNPVALALPCHRVVGAGGALTGYAGGLERKRWLHRHEGAMLAGA